MATMMIGFDFALLSRPYRSQRCTWQLLRLLQIAQRCGYGVRAIVSPEHLEAHRWMKAVRDVWSTERAGIDIYVAKGDAFYRNDNWQQIRQLAAFKVCLCNSDRCFREFAGRNVGPIQERCDLYLPCNHTAPLLRQCSAKVVPAAQPPDPRIVEQFCRDGLLNAYLDDDVETVRTAYATEPSRGVGFLGSMHPHSRLVCAQLLPEWVEVCWARARPPREYLRWTMSKAAILDLRGFGDKSLRFTEAVLLGRAVVRLIGGSEYYPQLQHAKNCLLLSDWSELERYRNYQWAVLAAGATEDYRRGWSQRALLREIVCRWETHPVKWR